MANSLNKLIEKQFGVDTRPVQRTVAVGGLPPATQLCQNDPNRAMLLISNTSAETVYVSMRPNMGATEGVLLTPGGGFLNLIWRDDFHMVGYDWYATASGACSIEVLELVLEG